MTQQLVSVSAPADLDAGYTFDATVDGRTFTVTVPEGGVKQGQTFQVPYPEDEAVPVAVAQAAPAQQTIIINNGQQAPMNVGGPIKENVGVTGRWRKDMCACCETCFCPFWMVFCCPGVVLGQVMQRFKLDFIGQPGGNYSNTCTIVSIVTVVMSLLLVVLGSSTGVGSVVYILLVVYLIVAGTLTRIAFRQKYNIPASCCGESCVDDCCCMYWCGPCNICQMHRHTHDEREYPYELTSKTGLGPNAPEIV